MNDKELLELAAKAAGIEWEQTAWSAGWVTQTGKFWNPLTDDGDALRLAVKIGVIVDVRYTDPSATKYNSVNYWLRGESHKPHKGISFDLDVDPCAATRRAIVRAAAEIGKEMP